MIAGRFREWLYVLPTEARALFTVACLSVCLFSLFLFSAVWESVSQSWSDISRSEPRIARLKGYQAHEPTMVASKSQASLILQQMSFDASTDDSQTGAELQQALRGFAEEAGLTVRGSQLISGSEQMDSPDGFVLLAVELRMQGLPLALSAFLRDVYAHTPLLTISELNIIKVRDRRASRRRNQSNPSEEQNLELSVRVTSLVVAP